MGFKFKYQIKDLLMKDNKQDQRCYLPIMASHLASNKDEWSLGNKFMSNHYFVFDMTPSDERSEMFNFVGIGPANNEPLQVLDNHYQDLPNPNIVKDPTKDQSYYIGSWQPNPPLPPGPTPGPHPAPRHPPSKFYEIAFYTLLAALLLSLAILCIIRRRNTSAAQERSSTKVIRGIGDSDFSQASQGSILTVS